MRIVRQPESYNDILERIFYVTLFSGVVCTFWLAAISPEVHRLLESRKETSTLPVIGIGNVKILYCLVPIGVALLSRIVKLHDRISNVFRIRRTFDLNWILRPLAQKVGYPITGEAWRVIQASRRTAMQQTFYRYASFTAPKIDIQLVRSAADAWAWFWCCVEPPAIFLISAILFAYFDAWGSAGIALGVVGFITFCAWLQWSGLKRRARLQVESIVNSPEAIVDIRTGFNSVYKTSRGSN